MNQPNLVRCAALPLLFLFNVLALSVSYAQPPCAKKTLPRAEFDAHVDFARVDVYWYPEWLERHGGEEVYPEPLPSQEKWDHPYLNNKFPNSMHEDAYVSDVTNKQGPIPEDVEVQYFHVMEKGGQFPGMVPAFNFLSEDTLVLLAFGRADTRLLLVATGGEEMKLVDAMEVPGREYKAISLISKKKRLALFRNTVGGAYSYLSKDRYMYIPGADNDIYRVRVGAGRFDHENVEYIDLREQMHQGDFLDKHMTARQKENHLTALMPDANGNVWFTSQHGIVGLVHYSDTHDDDCPKVYAQMITYFGLIPKLDLYFHRDYKTWDDLPDFLKNAEEMTPELRMQFEEYFGLKAPDFEEVQNSIAVGKDGVYVLSDLALHKLVFNEETKRVELDPKWEENFMHSGLIYENDHTRKPGQLNYGSGSSPTLIGDRWVAISDNDTNQVNLLIFEQETGELVDKFPLFEPGKSAVENSMIGYGHSIIVGNTYGFVDPFEENPTPGGLVRFDFNENTGHFEQVANWPPYDFTYDPKIATPKLSTANGLIYVYDRDERVGEGEYKDWQITALDFRTGMRVFSLKPYFNEGEFDDNSSKLVKRNSLGLEHWDRKVFNNLMSTFSFGPGNALYLAAFRGFVRYSSAAVPGRE